jgi:hypothetical protein
MSDPRDDQLPDELAPMGDRLRAARHRADAMELDALKRRAMTQASRSAAPARRSPRRSRVLTLLLVAGLLGGSGATGVIAAKKSPQAKQPSAAGSQYKCNSGIGNGSEQPPTPPSPDCDPGNSPGNNATNQCEGPPTIQPPACRPTPQPKPNNPKTQQSSTLTSSPPKSTTTSTKGTKRRP